MARFGKANFWASAMAFVVGVAVTCAWDSQLANAFAQTVAAQPVAAQSVAAQTAPAPAVANSALADDSASSNRKTARLVFTGDLMHHKAQDRLALASKVGPVAGYLEMWAGIARTVAGADLAVGNLETPVNGGPVSHYPSFNARVEYLQAAARIGFDVLGFANNHSMDRGFKGFDATMNNIQAAGMQAMGDGQTVYVTVGGHRVAIIAFTALVNAGAKFRVPPDRRGPFFVRHTDAEGRVRLLQKIVEARGGADIVVVFVHWGNEYLFLPPAWARVWSREMAAAGADMVVGSHPHVVGPAEWIDGPDGRRTFVAYSLGNFSSGMAQVAQFAGTARFSTPLGYILDVNIDPSGAISPELKTVWTLHDSDNRRWATYRTVMGADLEADCAELDAMSPADVRKPGAVLMTRTAGAPHECRRYRASIKILPFK